MRVLRSNLRSLLEREVLGGYRQRPTSFWLTPSPSPSARSAFSRDKVGRRFSGRNRGPATLSFTLNDRRVLCSAAETKSGGVEGYWRRSADVVREEMLECFKIVDRMGPGVVYFGSARTPEEHPHFQSAKSLAKDMSHLLEGVTTWSGLGGGMMEAVSQGALEAGAAAAGFKIYREGGRWVGLDGSWEHPYLPQENYVTCEFFSARKHGLAEAAARRTASDRTAIVVLPGGTGTLDEVFEVIVLIQLDKLGFDHEVPVVLMNYGGFYDSLLTFLDSTVEYGAVGKEELQAMFKVCDTNQKALDYIAEFYGL